MTTTNDITSAQIRTLRAEAAEALARPLVEMELELDPEEYVA